MHVDNYLRLNTHVHVNAFLLITFVITSYQSSEKRNRLFSFRPIIFKIYEIHEIKKKSEFSRKIPFLKKSSIPASATGTSLKCLYNRNFKWPDRFITQPVKL